MNPSPASIPSSPSASTSSVTHNGISYSPYHSELELPLISSLIEKELSEPYIIYTYRYFLNQWPQLCWIAREPSASASQDHEGPSSVPVGTGAGVGVIVCKLDRHLKGERKLRGYIAMLSVAPSHRGKGIASHLVKLAMAAMIRLGAEEVVLETEADNEASLGLYERLGFMREKRLHSFYLNGKDCFRLVLSLPPRVKELILASVELPASMRKGSADTQSALRVAQHEQGGGGIL